MQEGLTNVVKHAGRGARALVRLRWEADGLEVEVEDDGRGGAPADGSRGLGLAGMRERLAVVGGRVHVVSTTAGWRVSARIPFSQRRTG
ncbi:MAG TPA: ATP-binding protein [Segeticoccus sp.]|nr:ATP-binding protein [Segeticoccus sp.]